MNKGTLIGFISSDIKGDDLKLKDGSTMRKIGFSIACQRKGKNAGADFPWVIAFGKTAEMIEKFFSKGRGIIVDFKVQTSSYTNKEGKKIYQTDLVVENVEFPPVKKSEESVQASDDTHTQSYNPPAEEPSEMDFINIPDADDMEALPFKKR
jgi:single-strand DNA-binding protein